MENVKSTELIQYSTLSSPVGLQSTLHLQTFIHARVPTLMMASFVVATNAMGQTLKYLITGLIQIIRLLLLGHLLNDELHLVNCGRLSVVSMFLSMCMRYTHVIMFVGESWQI